MKNYNENTNLLKYLKQLQMTTQIFENHRKTFVSVIAAKYAVFPGTFFQKYFLNNFGYNK